MMENKVFSAKADRLYPLTTLAGGGVVALSLWIWLGLGWFAGVILLCGAGITFLVGLAQLLCTRYVVGPGSLRVRSGLSKIDVLYDDMEWMGEEKSDAADGYVPMSLARKALYIYFRQGGKMYRLELSPADREGFRQELVRRAPHLA